MISYLSVGIILFVAVCFFVYVYVMKSKGNLKKKQRSIEQLPSMLSTLGVLGTFIGITIGLWFFDPSNLGQSVPFLLGGLKTAFFTSLAGMTTSFFLGKTVNSIYDEYLSELPTDNDEATARICKSIETLGSVIVKNSNEQVVFYNTLIASLKAMEEKMDGISASNNHIVQMATAQAVSSQNTEKCISYLTDAARQAGVLAAGMTNDISAMVKSVSEMGRNVSGMAGILSEIDETTGQQANMLQETLEINKKFNEIMRGYIDEIEEEMRKTNTLLSDKFDEFSVLLRESNTKSLVEVMRKVTEEFQKQMSDLINRLVQENFKELNNSVQRLNQWQQENKEMVERLVKQYSDMADEFEGTSKVLRSISEDTRSMVSDDSMLKNLVVELQRILIEDNSFTAITKKLMEAVENVSKGTREYNEATDKLNRWLSNHERLAQDIESLTARVDAFVKDNGGAWRTARADMEESMNAIRKSSVEMDKYLDQINQVFYDRLSATLSNLDACIAAVMNKNLISRR